MSVLSETRHERVQFSELSTGLGLFLGLWGHRLENQGWELIPEDWWCGHGSRYHEYSGLLVLQTKNISSHLPRPSRPTPGTSCPP